MTQTNFSFPRLDIEEERRRALAKVYSLLIKLAEQAENKASALDNISDDVLETPEPLQENTPPEV